MNNLPSWWAQADDDDSDPFNPDPDNSESNICSEPPLDDDAFSLYTVELIGSVAGGPDTWEGSAQDGKAIHLPTFNIGDMTLDLSVFLQPGGGI